MDDISTRTALLKEWAKVPLTPGIIWFAGLFEGEGSIVSTRPGEIRLQIGSTDGDVVRSVLRIVGGNLKGPYDKGLGNKPIWNWMLARREDAAPVLVQIRPLLHSRRGQKADEVLESWRTYDSPLRVLKPIEHGTINGFSMETHRGIPHCVECRLAANSYQRERLRRQRATRSCG
jgi:hypothetical protein